MFLDRFSVHRTCVHNMKVRVCRTCSTCFTCTATRTIRRKEVADSNAFVVAVSVAIRRRRRLLLRVNAADGAHFYYIIQNVSAAAALTLAYSRNNWICTTHSGDAIVLAHFWALIVVVVVVVIEQETGCESAPSRNIYNASDQTVENMRAMRCCDLLDNNQTATQTAERIKCSEILTSLPIALLAIGANQNRNNTVFSWFMISPQFDGLPCRLERTNILHPDVGKLFF